MDFSSRQLRAFLLVAQHRSFTRAATALYITPSGLSLLVREFETQLGFRLFDRTTRQVALTRQGEELLPIVARAVHEIEQAATGIGRKAQAARRFISVGAPPMFAANVLPQAIREFQRAHPDCEIHLFDGTLNSIVERLEQGKLDIGLGTFALTPNVVRRAFFRFSLVAIFPESNPTAGRVSLSWASLHGESVLCMHSSSPTQRIIDRRLKDAGVEPRRRVVEGTLDTVIAMVEAGHGMAVIPSFGQAICRHRKISVMRLVNPVATSDFHLIHRRRKLAPDVETFTSFLQAYVKTWAVRAGVT